jgi:hypothetical protein
MAWPSSWDIADNKVLYLTARAGGNRHLRPIVIAT